METSHMKKTLTFSGVALTLLVLLMVPSLPAAHYAVIVDSQKANIIQDLQAIDFQTLQDNLQNQNMKDQLQPLDVESLQQRIKNLDAETTDIQIIYVYFILMHLLTTLLMGKPSVSRMLLTITYLQTFITNMKTGEKTELGANEYGYAIALVLIVLGAFLYRISKNKTIGTILFTFFSSLATLIQRLIVSLSTQTTG